MSKLYCPRCERFLGMVCGGSGPHIMHCLSGRNRRDCPAVRICEPYLDDEERASVKRRIAAARARMEARRVVRSCTEL
jgi:hypothetical protein